MPSIVDIAVGNDAFQTLVTAVKVAGLVEALASPGPFTVFAPHDAAFAKLPPGTITSLVQNPPQLARILKFHVVAGCYHRADLNHHRQLVSLEGTTIDLYSDEHTLEVNNATVIAADVVADNGVIHVIDTVILMRPHWFAGIMASARSGLKPH
ncbi:MAG: fasciclin domain-containing protein [Oscillatoriales cyanobacterium SM2_2_1]|nr:fasciclin domain-containing protein [Oscillatoriales cyanobacterium SM2_2_1]